MSRRRAQGFTLLEMLVAITVLTVLVALVYGMLRMAMRSWESGTARIEASDVMRIGWSFLQRSLNNAQAVRSKREDTPGIHFFGTADALEFVADMPAYLGSGGLHALGIGLEPDPRTERPRLVLRRIPLGDYANISRDPEQVQEAVLAEDVSRLQLSYYGNPAADTGAAWQNEWQSATSLPVLIRVDVALADGSHWPALIAHPRLGLGRQEEELPAVDADLQELQDAEVEVPGAD